MHCTGNSPDAITATIVRPDQSSTNQNPNFVHDPDTVAITLCVLVLARAGVSAGDWRRRRCRRNEPPPVPEPRLTSPPRATGRTTALAKAKRAVFLHPLRSGCRPNVCRVIWVVLGKDIRFPHTPCEKARRAGSCYCLLLSCPP